MTPNATPDATNASMSNAIATSMAANTASARRGLRDSSVAALLNEWTSESAHGPGCLFRRTALHALTTRRSTQRMKRCSKPGA